MLANTARHWSDDRLKSILDETGNWTVNGIRGAVLCRAASLHVAIEAATKLSAQGCKVIALVRGPDESIVVFEEQMRRVWPVPRVAGQVPDEAAGRSAAAGADADPASGGRKSTLPTNRPHRHDGPGAATSYRSGP
jgi:hypothetical protein